MNQCVGFATSLQYRLGIAVAVDDPVLLGQEIAVQFQILVVRYRRAALFKLQLINDVKRQPCDRGQLPSQGGFPAARIPKNSYSFHGLSLYHATKRSSA